MEQMRRAIMLPIFTFVLFIILIAFDMTYTTTTEAIIEFDYEGPYAHNAVDINLAQLYDNGLTVGWAVCLFFFIALMVNLFWGSHQKEHETFYREAYDPNNRR